MPLTLSGFFVLLFGQLVRESTIHILKRLFWEFRRMIAGSGNWLPSEVPGQLCSMALKDFSKALPLFTDARPPPSYCPIFIYLSLSPSLCRTLYLSWALSLSLPLTSDLVADVLCTAFILKKDSRNCPVTTIGLEPPMSIAYRFCFTNQCARMILLLALYAVLLAGSKTYFAGS